MEIQNAKAMFVEDDEGIIAITDLSDLPTVIVGEFVYDGNNVAFLNRDNHFFAIQNIPPYLRKRIIESEEITVVEQRQKEMYAYLVHVRTVDDMKIPDTWDEYSQNAIATLQKQMSAADFDCMVQAAEKFKP